DLKPFPEQIDDPGSITLEADSPLFDARRGHAVPRAAHTRGGLAAGGDGEAVRDPVEAAPRRSVRLRLCDALPGARGRARPAVPARRPLKAARAALEDQRQDEEPSRGQAAQLQPG